MTAIITFLIASPIIILLCAAIWADERYDLLPRAARLPGMQWLDEWINEPEPH